LHAGLAGHLRRAEHRAHRAMSAWQEWLTSRSGSVAFYMFSSAGMMIFNKLTLQAVHLPIALVVIQMSFTALVLLGVPSMRASIQYGTWRDAIRWARVIPPLFAVMLASSMIALRHASMGAVVVFRNIAPIPTLAVEALVGEHVQVDLPTVLSLLAALGGVVLYSRHDIEFSPKGALWMLLNMAAARGTCEKKSRVRTPSRGGSSAKRGEP